LTHNDSRKDGKNLNLKKKSEEQNTKTSSIVFSKRKFKNKKNGAIIT
jgi:hypothetical protein